MDSINKNEILTYKIVVPTIYIFMLCVFTVYSYNYPWDYAFKYLFEKPLNIIMVLIFTYSLPRAAFLHSQTQPTKKQNTIILPLTIITFILGIYMSVPI